MGVSEYRVQELEARMDKADVNAEAMWAWAVQITKLVMHNKEMIDEISREAHQDRLMRLVAVFGNGGGPDDDPGGGGGGAPLTNLADYLDDVSGAGDGLDRAA